MRPFGQRHRERESLQPPRALDHGAKGGEEDAHVAIVRTSTALSSSPSAAEGASERVAL